MRSKEHLSITQLVQLSKSLVSLTTKGVIIKLMIVLLISPTNMHFLRLLTAAYYSICAGNPGLHMIRKIFLASAYLAQIQICKSS